MNECLKSTPYGRDYSEENYFALEQKNIFGKEWMCAARLSDVADEGAYRKIVFAGEEIIIVRGLDSIIRAFYNVCPHRGAALCESETGMIKRNIRCPYHAWSFNLEGKLVAAPNMVSLGDIDRSIYGLKPIASREWLGYLWLSLAEQPPDFDQSVIGAVNERLGDDTAIHYYCVDTLALAHRKRYDVQANWKLIIENFMECYHCAIIHPELVDVLPEFTKGVAAQVNIGHGALFGKNIQGFTVDGSAGQNTIATLPAERDRKYYAITIRPTVFINLMPDHVVIHRMYPLAVDRTIVECDWLFESDIIDQGADISPAVELFDRVNLQDFHVCEITQPGMKSRAYSHGGVLVPVEHHIVDFHQWVHTRVDF